MGLSIHVCCIRKILMTHSPSFASTFASNTCTASRWTGKYVDFCRFGLGWVEAPGSSQGSRGGPQSAKQGLLCCQEEAAVPQDKGNCQCRTSVSLQSWLYHVSWNGQHVILMNLVKALPLLIPLAVVCKVSIPSAEPFAQQQSVHCCFWHLMFQHACGFSKRMTIIPDRHACDNCGQLRKHSSMLSRCSRQGSKHA